MALTNRYEYAGCAALLFRQLSFSGDKARYLKLTGIDAVLVVSS